MDQEDFEAMASIGERPVGRIYPVLISAAEDSDQRSVANPLVFDYVTGRITFDHDHEHFHIPFYNSPGNDNNDGADSVSGLPPSPPSSDV